MTATILEGDVDTRQDYVVESIEDTTDACEWDKEGDSCQLEATHILSLKCCGQESRYCEDHVLYIANAVTKATAIHHGSCGKTTYKNPKCHVTPIKS